MKLKRWVTFYFTLICQLSFVLKLLEHNTVQQHNINEYFCNGNGKTFGEPKIS